MKLMAIVIIIGWIVGVKTFAQTNPNTNSQAVAVMSFKDWKKAEVDKAQSEVLKLETVERVNPVRFGPEEKEQLKTAKNNLTIAQELNAQDYFVLYLSPNFQNDIQAFTQAVQNMDPQDVALILLSYNKLIEEKKRKNVVPSQNSRFGFGRPRKVSPEVILSSVK